jgi:hypothetical protein
MSTAAHDPTMGTNRRRLDMLDKRARETLKEVAQRCRAVGDDPIASSPMETAEDRTVAPACWCGARARPWSL